MIASHRVALNTGFLYAKMAITVFISLYSTRLILAALGVIDFGIFNVVGGAISMLTFLNIAMTSATQRFMSYAQGEGSLKKQLYIFNVSVVLHFLIAFIILIILEVAGWFLFNGILEIPENRISIAKLLYQFMLVSTFFTIISVPYDAVINAHENMKFVAVIGIFQALLKLAIAIYITSTTFDKLLTYGVLMVFIPVSVLSLNIVYCRKKYEEVSLNFNKYYNKTLFKSMTNFASWSLLGSTTSIITMQGITIILNAFFGVIVNAAQGIATQITGQLMAFSTTMLKALNPVIVKSEGADDRKKMLKASITGNKLSFYLLALFSIPTLVEMPFILDVWLKDVPAYAVVFCRLNLLRVAISQLTVTFPTAIGAIGQIKQITKWDSAIYILPLPISYIMFKLGAPPEVIYINLIVMVLALSFTRIYFLNKLGGLRVKHFLFNVMARCLGIFVVSVILSMVPQFFVNEGLLRLFVVLLLGSVSFVVGVSILGLDNNEKETIMGLWTRIWFKIITRKK